MPKGSGLVGLLRTTIKHELRWECSLGDRLIPRLFDKFRLQHHFPDLVDAAIDVVIAIHDTIDFDFGPHF